MAITIEQFMAALGGQESGGSSTVSNNSGSGAYGTYQIMPENWDPWAREAEKALGLKPGALQQKTAQNQYLVARNKIQQYYDSYGNWEDVAAVWYSGQPLGPNQNNKQYYNGDAYPSIREYVNSVVSKAGGYPANGRGPTGDIEMADPQFSGAKGKIGAVDFDNPPQVGSSNPFNFDPNTFNDSGSGTDQGQLDLNRQIHEWNVKKDQWSIQFAEMDAEWKRLMDERDYYLSIGELDLSRQAESNASYFKQQSLMLEQSIANADRELLKYQTDLDYQYKLQSAKNDADKNAIELARNQDLAAIAKMDDATVRQVSSQQNMISGFNAETQRIGTLGQLAQGNNEFIHNLYSNPRDHFGLFMAQEGITPDWDRYAAGGSVIQGDPLRYKDPLNQYDPNVTMPGDFGLGDNPFAGQVGAASGNVQQQGFSMPDAPQMGTPKTLLNINGQGPQVAPTQPMQQPQKLPVAQPIVTATQTEVTPNGVIAPIPPGPPSTGSGGVTMLPGGAITTQPLNFNNLDYPGQNPQETRDNYHGMTMPEGNLVPSNQYYPQRFAEGSPYTNAPVMMTGDSRGSNPFQGGARPEMIFNPTQAPLGIANSQQTRQITGQRGQGGGGSPVFFQQPPMPGLPPGGGYPVGNIQPQPMQIGRPQQQGMGQFAGGRFNPQPMQQGSAFQFNPQLVMQNAADFGVNPYQGIGYYGQQPTQLQQMYANALQNKMAQLRAYENSGMQQPQFQSPGGQMQVPRFAGGTYPMQLPNSQNPWMPRNGMAPRLEMVADFGMPISPATQKAVTGQSVGLGNTANAFTGRGGGVLPSLQSLRNMTTSQLGNFQGYAEGPVGISFNDIFDYISGATKGLGQARSSMGVVR